MKKSLSQNCKKKMGENTLIHCSQRTVVHVHVNAFFKIHPACHSDANRIKPGSNLKKTDNHAAENSKTVCLDVN